MDILLVENNMELAALIQAFLNKEGFSLWHETSGEGAADWLQEHHPKIILLDIMLPGMDGFAFCQMVRRQYDVPILILSAKSEKEDQLTGFQLGADDYLQKPVDIDILHAKIHAILTRAYEKTPSKTIVSGQLSIDISSHKVKLHGHDIEVNAKEYELLLCLVKNEGKTLSKEFLFNHIWGADSESENQTLTVHIKMLRSKIEDDPRKPKRIQTVWGVGYRYEEV
ncbi:MAG: response regulator transcription factor [Erysipelotrichaceae bacterium]|jgi:DNA-binding response OmpR family regulator|nr:response regulator transcription factor [Erysipelotrichaceae bacterium]